MSQNNCQLTQVGLDHRGLDYIKGELSFGWELSKTILRTVDLSRGKVSVLVPDDLVNVDLYDWDTAIYKESGHHFWSEIKIEVFHLFQEFIKTGSNGLMISETLASPVPVGVANNYGNHVFFGGYLYLVRDKLSRVIEVDNLFRKSRGYPFVLTFTYLSNPCQLITSGSTLGEPILGELASNTQTIFVGVYDAESFIIWQKVDDK